jgi:hypothetical protein
MSSLISWSQAIPAAYPTSATLSDGRLLFHSSLWVNCFSVPSGEIGESGESPTCSAALYAAFILPLDHETSVVYAWIKTRLRKDGQILADNDLWIAALAVRHSVALVSNNRAHFDRVPGLILISEAPR